MPLLRNCTAALLCACLGAPAAAQTPAAPPAEGSARFLVFVASRQIGEEQVNVARSGGGWIISATGRVAAPTESTTRFEVKYDADWQPQELRIEATTDGKPLRLSTSFGMTTAINEITQGGTTNSKTDQISVRTIVLPNNFFAAYEAMAVRLAGTKTGAELPVYVAPQIEIKANVTSTSDEDFKTPSGVVTLRRFDLVFQNPNGPLNATVTVDDRGRLARVEIPSAGLSVVRHDLAGVSSRPQVARNPTDADVSIPALGFNLAGTITTPPHVAGRLRHPAIVLVAGSGAVDRDATVAGIPIFTQLAGALAEKGFVVLRYDKRAVGQSGGRAERATLQDYADDVVAAVKWLRRRPDVDRERITVAGHSEGGAVAMIAAAKEEDEIDSLVLIAAPGTRGADLVLEQQQHGLDLLKATPEERKTKVDIQQRIQTAVLTGVGWEGLSPEYREAADSPWFKSFLEFNPAQVIKDVRQPILIVQGDLDTQVFPAHADKLAALARARKRKAPVEVLHLPGVNHLLVSATTGEVSEYATLKDKRVAAEIPARITEFLGGISEVRSAK